MPNINQKAAVFRARAADQRKSIRKSRYHRKGHQFKCDASAVIRGVRTKGRKCIDKLRHRRDLFLQIADLEVPRAENLGCGQQFSFQKIRLCFGFAVEEPVGEEFKLDVLQAIVVENLLHLFQRGCFEDVKQVGVPDSESFESRARCRFDPGFEIERAVLLVGKRQSAAGDGPVGSEQLYIIRHEVPSVRRKRDECRRRRYFPPNAAAAEAAIVRQARSAARRPRVNRRSLFLRHRDG